MQKCIKLLVFFSLVALAFSVKAASEWGPNTPGVALTISQTESGTYTLKGKNLPRTLSYTLWIKTFNGVFPAYDQEFYVDYSGELKSRGEWPILLKNLQINVPFNDFLDGEPLEFGLISTDDSVQAIAKITPNPIADEDRGCSFSMELAAADGISFIAKGAGFIPGERVEVVSKSAHEVVNSSFVVPDSGSFIGTVLPSVSGVETALASHTMKASHCEISVDYRWRDLNYR
ncbi:MAG: hypothetical protein AAEF72_04120 [Gammaproteobacteria bacterium]|jgi:hypothetical protein